MTGIALRAQHLTRRLGDITAVDDLSLEVRRGEILDFLGPNGAGKTTTLRIRPRGSGTAMPTWWS